MPKVKCLCVKCVNLNFSVNLSGTGIANEPHYSLIYVCIGIIGILKGLPPGPSYTMLAIECLISLKNINEDYFENDVDTLATNLVSIYIFVCLCVCLCG